MVCKSRWAEEDGEYPDEEDEEEGKQKLSGKKHPGKKNKKKTKAKVKNNKSNKKAKVTDEKESLYKAGDYNQQRLDYISKWRSKGYTFQECSEGWKNSTRRKKLLANMSQSELKRRRFI